MGDFGVIADVSAVIVESLTRALHGLSQVEPPIAELNDLSEPVSTPPPKLTVFPTRSPRTRRRATGRTSGPCRRTRPPPASRRWRCCCGT